MAMPLRWDELGKVRSGLAFDIVSTVQRIKRLKKSPGTASIRSSKTWTAWPPFSRT